VVDFIDMSEPRHVQAVEKRLKEATRHDRARIQIGRISQFGLLELSRQRLRPSLIETNSTPCHHCRGTGLVRSIESMSLFVLRAIESKGIEGHSAEIIVTVPAGVDLYLLNQKRSSLTAIEARYQMKVTIGRDDTLDSPDFRLESLVERKEPFVLPQSQHAPKIELAAETENQELETPSPLEKPEAPLEEARHKSPQGEGGHRRRRRQLYSNRRDRERHRDGNHHHQHEQPHPEERQSSSEAQNVPELTVIEGNYTKEKGINEAAQNDSSSEKQTSSKDTLKPAMKKNSNRRRTQRQPQSDKGKQEAASTDTVSAKPEPSPLKVVPQEDKKVKEISVPITALPQGPESAHKKNSRSRWWKRLIES
jgi:ribonuclease E